MLIVGPGGENSTVARVRKKLARAREFAEITFPGDEHLFEVWSPRVPVGKTTDAFEAMSQEFEAAGKSLKFVINEDYTARMRDLVEHAAANTSATSEPAYRMLQIMTHLRGASIAL